MIKSPIVYIGSKFKLLDKLIPLMPINQGLDFVDVFTGGGSVYLNVLDKFKTIYANDIISELIQIHENFGNKAEIEKSILLSSMTKDNQERYLTLRKSFNTSKSWKLLLALIWSCNSNMMRFNSKGEFNQTWGKRCASPATIQNCHDVANIDLTVVKYSSLPFQKLTFEKNMFVYFDPPYSNTGAGYNTTWSHKDDIDLINLIHELNSQGIKFGLSGCQNENPNPVHDSMVKAGYKVHYFGDLYQNIAKKERTNQEYYFTNVKI